MCIYLRYMTTVGTALGVPSIGFLEELPGVASCYKVRAFNTKNSALSNYLLRVASFS